MTTDSKKTEKKQSVVASAAAMSLGTLGSRILGLLRDIVLQTYFSRSVTDAFAVAFGFPNKFRRLLGEGSLSVSFIPVYLEKRQKSEEEARRLADGMMALLFSISGALCVLGVIFMKPLMGLLVSGEAYQAVPGKFANTIRLGQIMFSYLFLVTTYAYFMALLNAHKKFFVPAFAPALFNLTFIIFAMLPAAWSRFPGELLAWGVIVGGLVQWLLVALPLWKEGLLPRMKWRGFTPGLAMVLRNMLPGMMGMGVLQFLTLININYASRLSEGSHTYIYLADRILELPQSLIAISLGAVLLPSLSELWSSGKRDEMLSLGQRHMQTLLFLAVPSALGMFVLAEPIVEVLYMRGRFSIEDVGPTAQIVQFYSILLLASSLTKVTIPNFYAIKNTWLPAVTSVFSVLCHIIIAPFLMKDYGLNGLVTSMVFSGILNFFLIFVAYRFLLGPYHWKSHMVFLLKLIGPLVAMGAFISWFYSFSLANLGFVKLSAARAISLFSTIGLGATIYFFVAGIFKVTQSRAVTDRLKRKLKIKF